MNTIKLLQSLAENLNPEELRDAHEILHQEASKRGVTLLRSPSRSKRLQEIAKENEGLERERFISGL